MLLNLRRKPQHTHDLGHPGAGNTFLPCDLGLGCDLTGLDEGLPFDGLPEAVWGRPGQVGLCLAPEPYGTRTPTAPPLKIALPALDLHSTTDIDCIVFVSPRMELPHFSGRLTDWDSGGAPQFQYGDVFSLLLRWVLPHRAALFAIHRLILRRSAIVA